MTEAVDHRKVNLGTLSGRTRKDEDNLDYIVSNLRGMLRTDYYDTVNRLVIQQAEIRFFINWIYKAPEEVDMAAERLIQFLTNGEFSLEEVVKTHQQRGTSNEQL